MAHIVKLEQYHKSIRKQELHSLFQEKRIALIQQLTQQSHVQLTQFQEISQNSLIQMAQACQSEQGIEQVYNLMVQDKLETFLSVSYLNTKCQQLASLILCNLHIIPRPCPPSTEFTGKLIELLEKGNERTVSNCVTLIFNITHDHPQWKQSTIRNFDLCLNLNNLLYAPNLSQSNLMNILRTIIKLLQKSKAHDSFKYFFPKIIQYFSQYCQDYEIITHAYFCYYLLSLLFLKDSIEYNLQYNLIHKFTKIAPLMMQSKFTVITLHLISFTLKGLNSQTIQEAVLPYLSSITRNGLKNVSTKIKELVLEILTNLLVEEKMLAEDLMKCPAGQLALQHFAIQDDPDIIHYQVYLFSTVIMNIELSPLTQQLQALFERVEMICPREIQTIGFVKETIYKARQRAQFY